jgi:hypothetical protein
VLEQDAENIWTEERLNYGDWRMLHTEELHNLHSSTSTTKISKSRRMRWAKHVVGGGGEESISVIGRNARGEGTSRKAKALMDFRDMGLGCVDWFYIAYDSDPWRWVQYHAGKLLGSCTTGGLSIRAELHGVSKEFI